MAQENLRQPVLPVVAAWTASSHDFVRLPDVGAWVACQPTSECFLLCYFLRNTGGRRLLVKQDEATKRILRSSLVYLRTAYICEPVTTSNILYMLYLECAKSDVTSICCRGF